MSEHWNRVRTMADYRADRAIDMQALAAVARTWLEAPSPIKRRVALEAVKGALLRVIEVHDPKGYLTAKAAHDAQRKGEPVKS